LTGTLHHLDQNGLKRFRRHVRNWYDKNARDLPWRDTADPYRIWISEIMLQQTTVATVMPYFERFLQRFPTLETLSSADEDDVLRAWEGLGYYSRARNIHKTSKQVVEELDGRFPETVEELSALPGIGRYTAGAIVSFAFDRAAPIVEANTQRLYSRLLALRGDVRKSAAQQVLWEFAEQILPRKSPGNFNQALMELGATVCKPADPSCETCPLCSCCRTFAEGAQAEIPERMQRPVITRLTEATLGVRKGDRYLLRRRGAYERWARLWDFPRFSVEDQAPPKGVSRSRSRSLKKDDDWGGTKRQLEENLFQQTGIVAEVGTRLTELNHSVTRYQIRLLCFLASHRSGEIDETEETCWVKASDFGEYPLSVTGRKFAKLLKKLE